MQGFQPALLVACRLLNVDVYSFDFKIHHIARHIQLPDEPVVSAAAKELPPDEQLPPLLIINVQLPTYAVSQHFHSMRSSSGGLQCGADGLISPTQG